MPSPTHQYVQRPRVGVRYLADYMAGSKRNERRILQLSKYRPIAKVIQHTDAQIAISKFMRSNSLGVDWLMNEADALRNRLADDDFDRHLFDSNADYIARFASVWADVALPSAEILPPGKAGAIVLHGVRVTVGLHIRLRRTTRTNKVREGAAMLRYAKGKQVSSDAAAWQAAFLLGYLQDTSVDQDVQPEGKLCLVIDAYAGACHAAPTNSVRRYQNMQAACASIAEQWPNIKPPPDAILA
jgi:hypothetical protein